MASGSTRQNGSLLAWGAGQLGQLGLGFEANQAKPVEVAALAGEDIAEVAAAGNQTAVRTVDGKVFTFGNGKDGLLGHGGGDKSIVPKRVDGLRGVHVAKLAVSEHHMAAIDGAS